MKITRLHARLLRIPIVKSVALPIAGATVVDRQSPVVLLIQAETDAGVAGLGFGCICDGGRSLMAAVADDLMPMLIGENALNHERLWAKTRLLENPASQRAYAIVDIALWDLKGNATRLPLWRLLGGARDTAKAFTAETAPAHLTADDTIAIGRVAMANGVKGLRVGVRGVDPEAESRKIVTVRDALGEDVWFAVSVESRYDYETALPMARFLEEEVGADWFEDPLADDDLNGYSHLAAHTDTPLATGGRFTSVEQFVRLIETKTPITLRPDLIRLGGLTPLLKVAALAELYHRPVFPRLLPEVGVHLACGLPGVQAVEYTPALFPLFVQPPSLIDGNLHPPTGPGLGLELNPDAVAKYQIPAK